MEDIENRRFTDIPPEIHKRHHDYVSTLQTKEEIKKKMINDIKKSIISSIVWSAIVGMSAIFWYAFSQFVGK